MGPTAEEARPAGAPPSSAAAALAANRGRVRIGLGVVAMVAGVAGLVVGIVQAREPDTDFEARAVARSAAIDDGPLVLDARAGDYTIFVVVPVDGVEDEEGDRIQNGVVKDVTCTVERPGEESIRLRGSRQPHGVGTDAVASIGWFTTGAGVVRVACRAGDPADAGRALLVAPGRPSVWAGGLVACLGGLVLGALGCGLAGWGRRARRPSASGI